MRHNIYYPRDKGFAVKMGQVFGPIKSPMNEFVQIADDIPSRVQVLVSGGIDCEAMVRLLQKVGKDVTGVAYRFMFSGECVNRHDLAWLDQFPCDIRFETIHLEAFWASDWYAHFLYNFLCPSPQLPIQAYMALKESLELFTILPAIHPEPKLWNGRTVVQIREKDFAVMKALENQNILVSPLQSTPGMYASILASNEFTQFHTYNMQDGRERKPQQYKEWFDITVAPRPKYHGFEGFEWVDSDARKNIWELYEYPERWLFVDAEAMLLNFQTELKLYSPDNSHLLEFNEFKPVGTEK